MTDMFAKKVEEYDRVAEFVFDLEELLPLGHWKIDGFNVWDRIRLPLYRQIVIERDLIETPHTPVKRRPFVYAKGTYLSLRNILVSNPYFNEPSKILSFGHARRKKLEDGRWWDIYFDPLFDQLSLDYLHLERPNVNSHKQPPKTENLCYTDFIYYFRELVRISGLANFKFDSADLMKINTIQNMLDSEFNIKFSLESIIKEKLAYAKASKPLYDILLDRIKPQVVLLVVSYGKETFIESCKEKGIPVVELQHGGFGPDHLGYSFPGNRKKSSFPDYMFVFGKFWKDSVEFSIPDEHILPVGYPYLEQEIDKYKQATQKDQILIISQGTIGRVLSKFAVELANSPHFDYDIVYKLHPGEYERWEKAYPWLKTDQIQVVYGDNPALYQILSESKAQLGVNSTVLYEGLNFGLITFLLNLPGVTQMDNLIADGRAKIVSSPNGVIQGIQEGIPSPHVDADYYFEPNSVQNIDGALHDIIESH